MNQNQLDDFLLCCLRAHPCKTAANAAPTDDDWQSLLQQAARHGIAPLLYHRLKTCHSELSIPPHITQQLRQAYLDNSARNLMLSAHLAHVLKLLRDASIPVIALKGAQLAEQFYALPALRYMGDLDVLLKSDDLPRVDALLLGMGCTPTEQHRIEAQDNNEFAYIMPDRAVTLEVHWKILSALFPFAIDTEGLWARAQPARLAGVEAAVLCPEDLLLHLCLHAGCTHGFEPGLKLFCDIAEIIQHAGGVNWAQVQQRAAAWGIEKCVYLTLKLTEELLAVTLPTGLLNDLKPDDFDERFVTIAKEQIFSRRDGTRQPLSMWPAVASFWGATRLRDKIQLFIRGFFLPRAAMARLYPVPADSPRLYLYYVVRLRDLVRVYGHDVWRWLTRDQAMQAVAQEGAELTTLKTWLARPASAHGVNTP